MNNLLQYKELAASLLSLISSTTIKSQKPKAKRKKATFVRKLSQIDNSKRFRYMLFFMKESILGLTRKQSLDLSVIDNTYQGFFNIHKDEYNNWLKAFKHSKTSLHFSFYLKSSTNSFLRIMADLGINLKNVLHLRNEFIKHQKGCLFKEGEYAIIAQVDNIKATGRSNAIVTCSSTIYNSDGQTLIKNIDHFMIRNVIEKDQRNIRILNSSIDTSYRTWLKAPDYGKDEIIYQKDYDVSSRMGIDYGFVSGDLNLVHTTNTMAKIFGFKRAFIQGLCTANIVIAHLPENLELNFFAINFNKPVYTNSAIRVEYASDNFKVLDRDSNVLVHGTHR